MNIPNLFTWHPHPHVFHPPNLNLKNDKSSLRKPGWEGCTLPVLPFWKCLSSPPSWSGWPQLLAQTVQTRALDNGNDLQWMPCHKYHAKFHFVFPWSFCLDLDILCHHQNLQGLHDLEVVWDVDPTTVRKGTVHKPKTSYVQFGLH